MNFRLRSKKAQRLNFSLGVASNAMTMTATDLLHIAYPAEFAQGAQSAVTTCLRIEPAEKVTLITDRATEQIAASIGEQLEARGCAWNAFLLEDLAPRPL